MEINTFGKDNKVLYFYIFEYIILFFIKNTK